MGSAGPAWIEMFNGSSVIDTEMLHITIENSEFVRNGSISGPGVDHIYFEEEYDDVLRMTQTLCWGCGRRWRFAKDDQSSGCWW